MTKVYLHKFPNGKVYVGIADNPEQRWNGGAGYIGNRAMYADIMRYGWRNIEHIILAKCDTREDALRMERGFILIYDSENPEKGYNQTETKAGRDRSKPRDTQRIVKARNLFTAAAIEAGLNPNKLKLRSQGDNYGVYYNAYFVGYYYPARAVFCWGRKERKTSRTDGGSLAAVLLKAIMETTG